MLERETILPLSVGATIALLAHLLLLPAMAQSLRQDALPVWPDLQVASLTTTNRAIAGRDVNVSLSIINRGQAPTPAGQPLKVRVMLSVDDKPSTDDIELFTHDLPAKPGSSVLAAGETSAMVTQTVTLPDHSHGQRFLIAMVDPDLAIDEGPHENNNILAQPLMILSPEQVAKPDLVLLAATSPTSVKVGEKIEVQFSVGGATDSEPVVMSWFDGVFLSSDDKISDDDLLLSATPGPVSVLRAGMAYSRVVEVQVDLPVGANPGANPGVNPGANPAGRMYLLFFTDHLNRIDEIDETNNLVARPIRIIHPDSPVAEDEQPSQPRGPADLHVPVFTAPDAVMNGETLGIDFIVANQGEGITSASQWRDRVYLSKDDKLDAGDKLLATYERQDALRPGGYYNARVTGHIDLPEEESGPMFLIFKADDQDFVHESNKENNIRVRPIQIEQLMLGKDKEDEDRTTVAWIPYDDFRKLIAPASETEQPALQSKVEPITGAPTPRDPSPPSPPQPQPVEVTQAQKTPDPTEETKAAKQRDPSDTPATPAKQVEAKSPIVEPSPKPVTQPEAIALAPLPVAPRPQPPAQGPDKTGNPATQPEAQTPAPTVGTPATQTEIALPKPIAPQVDPTAAKAKEDMEASEAREAARAPVTTTTPTPSQQPRAESPVPTPGDPTKLVPSIAPPADKGEATTLAPSQTPTPDKDGKPTLSPEQQGTEQPTPKPAPSAAEDAKATPKAEDEKAVKPVPPTQPSNPTSAPRDESDVPPTILEEKQFAVEPGGVITRPGIQITASTPDITTTSWLVSGPTAVNPIVRITFDREGKVKRIDMIRSSGHANLDSPIQASFFNFRARGEALKKVRDTFSIEIKLLLKNERE